MHITVPLSKLVASRRNPRRVKPEREAHTRLVASIRAHGLLEPLVVMPEGDGYRIIAGNRRLAALRCVHDGKATVPCVVRKVEAEEAESLSLAENFIREPMHPLDEAETFARLASIERKGVTAIAAEFGVSEHYVRQRIKLASLCGTVKDAYRSGVIDTATAEAFTAVHEARQEEVWDECGGRPHDAEQVRNLVEDRWIDASLALFDIASLPPEALSSDLFRDSVLIERKAFLNAQAEALVAESERLREDGWAEVVIGDRGDVHTRLYNMVDFEPALTEAEQTRIDALSEKMEALNESEDEADQSEREAVEEEMDAILQAASGRVSETDKARGTLFIVIDPSGKVERHARVPRAERAKKGTSDAEPAAPLTVHMLTDPQKEALSAHHALAVRVAVAGNPLVQKRLLVLALHGEIARDAIAIRHAPSDTSSFAGGEASPSPAWVTLTTQQDGVDPFVGEHFIDEAEAYRRLCELDEPTLDRIIASLVPNILTGFKHRSTPLLEAIASELTVNPRQHWTPDAQWLAGYRKIQLAGLLGTLKGPPHGSAALSRKKSELVVELAALFEKAASEPASLNDAALAARVKGWMPERR